MLRFFGQRAVAVAAAAVARADERCERTDGDEVIGLESLSSKAKMTLGDYTGSGQVGYQSCAL